MPLSSLVDKLSNSSVTSELIARLDRTERLLMTGAPRSGRAILATAIARRTKRPLLIIVPTMEEASRWLALLQLMGWEKSLLYPTSEGSPYESFDPTSEITWGQLQVLGDLINNDNHNLAIVGTERSLQPHLPIPKVLTESCITLTKGDRIDLEEFCNQLVSLGYIRAENTEQEGQWSRRGDILDLYPVSNELPVRLEFFGEDLDKLREFDPISQRSLDSINKISVTATDFNHLIANQLRENLPNGIENLLNESELEELLEGSVPEGMRRLMGLAWEKPSSLIDYLPKSTCVVIDDRQQCIAHGNKWIAHVIDTYKSLDYKEDINHQNNQIKIQPTLHKPIQNCLKEIEQYKGFDMTELKEERKEINNFDICSRPIPKLPNQFGKMGELIRELVGNKTDIWLLSAQPSRAVSLLEEHDCISKFVPNSRDYPSIERLIDQNTPVALKAKGYMEIQGIHLPAWKVAVITDREFFGQQNINSPGYVRRRRRSSSRAVNPNKMSPGDYVVHKNHGIGQFIKIDKLSINNELRDYIVVQYLDGKLSVAADQLGSLGRYRTTGDKNPKINKLGGSTWSKLKERTKKAVKKIAIDLVKLYAERHNSKGHAFPKDGPWQQELEDSFAYEPTPDQLKAVEDTKNDMEMSQPMDRLICGDVGFGKTEVAIRAIFKAVTSGKQIAMLAPTTVLSQQHWRTISDRFAPYPIKVALLNRFRTATEKKNIVNGLKNGTIDCVIGTHQVLSKSIEFKNLGLLVVDEEQRFGVTQKEKIKVLRKDVDVLTLSATPIPRTLYMSLSGVREMSLILTPPPQRRSIKTHLAAKDDETIRSAICQEIDRGGQIFYVVPRIEGISDVANSIQQMIPNIRLIIAHGQMAEGELENSMVAFNAGEADLMLCTTIIESGLDIPRVNTILVEDSHRFGLSQLYQLRGRVGRSGVQAHAWLFYPRETILSDTAKQRLRAIQEFSQLGSGYQLAMRDMEIRGVGNILGVEQSGQMELVGFDLYMEMLQESLAEIQGQSFPKVDDTQIDLPLTAFIPGDWITNNEDKISAYRSATECTSKEDLMELVLEWSDRYGALPGPVETLIQVMKLKLIAKICGFSRIRQEKPNITLETPMEEPAFKLLRQGLPKHLQSRLIFQAVNGKPSKVIARGLAVLPIEKQVEELISWLKEMERQIPDQDGLKPAEREANLVAKNDEVIRV